MEKAKSDNTGRLMEAAQQHGVDLQSNIDQRQRDIASITELNNVQERNLTKVKRQNEQMQARLVALDKDYKLLQEQLQSNTKLLDTEVKRNEQLWAQYEA